MNAVEFRNVVKALGNEIVLRGTTFSIPEKCVATVLGPNGCGKTTILRIAIGALKPDYGYVRVLGHDPWREIEVVRKLVGYVPENPSYPRIEVGKLLTRVARLRLASASALEREVSRVVKLLGLERVLGCYANALSMGYRKRVAIALALLGEPCLLLMDDPLAGLDSSARDLVLDLVKRLRKSFGTSIVVTLQNLKGWTSIAEYVVVIRRGVVVAEGRVDEVSSKLEPLVRAVFRSQGVGVDVLARDVLSRFRVRSLSIRGDLLEVIVCKSVAEELRSFLEERGAKLIEMRFENLDELCEQLLGR